MARGITRQLAPASTSTAPSVEFLDARDQEQVDVLKGVIGDGQGKSATARANREELRVGNIELSAIGQVNAKGPKRLCSMHQSKLLDGHGPILVRSVSGINRVQSPPGTIGRTVASNHRRSADPTSSFEGVQQCNV